MAIQLRRGNRADLIPSKLLPGEFAICSDGTVVICHAPGQTKVLATKDDVEDILNSSPDAYNALQELMEELKKTGNPAANILASIQELRETKADKSYVDSATDYIKSASGILIHLPDSVSAPVAIRKIEGNSVQFGVPTATTPIQISHTGNAITLVSCGKNLLNVTAKTTTKNGITYTVNSDKSISLTGTTNQQSYLEVGKAFLEKGKPITIGTANGSGAFVGLYGRSKEKGRNVWFAKTMENPVTYTPTENALCSYYIQIDQSQTEKTYNETIYPIVEYGDTLSAYEAFNGTTKSISIMPYTTGSGAALPPMNMRKWDKICRHEDGKWYFDCNSNEAILDGSEGWIGNETTVNGYYVVISSTPKILDAKICSAFLSTIATYTHNPSVYSNNFGFCYCDSAFQFSVDTAIASTLDAWKAWLQANPVTVVYQTETVTSTELDPSVQTLLNSLYTRDGITNIFATNLAQPTITLDYARTATGRNIMEIRKGLNI